MAQCNMSYMMSDSGPLGSLVEIMASGDSSKRFQLGPEVITVFMLNAAEHEIFSANKCENGNNTLRKHAYIILTLLNPIFI